MTSWPLDASAAALSLGTRTNVFQFVSSKKEIYLRAATALEGESECRDRVPCRARVCQAFDSISFSQIHQISCSIGKYVSPTQTGWEILSPPAVG